MALTVLLSACQAQPTTISTAAMPTSVTRVSPGPTAARTARPNVPTPIPTVLPSIDPGTLRGLELSFWHPWSGEMSYQVQQMVDEFNRENIWGLHVSITAPGGGAVMYQQVTAAFSGENVAAVMPDVVAASIDQLVSWQITGKKVIDLTAYMQSSEWGLNPKDRVDYNPVFWQQDNLNGMQLGIPAERSARVLFYNTTWARELGFTSPPLTPEEFQKQACTAAQSMLKDKDKTNDGMGGWIIDRSASTLVSWMAAFDTPLVQAGTAQYHFNTPEAARAFAYMRLLFDQSCAWISRNPEPYTYFSDRQALFYSGDLSDIPAQERFQSHAGSLDSWTVIPFPAIDAKPRLVVSGSSYAIVKKKPAEQLGAWLFIRFLMLPRNQTRLLEASGTLPVSQSTLIDGTQWARALEEGSILQPAPDLADWWMARNILEDAAWQLYQPTPVPPANLLGQVDEMLPEIIQHQP